MHMGRATFAEAVCKYLGCEPAEYEAAVLWRCLRGNPLGLAKLVWAIQPTYFEPDLRLIHQLAGIQRFSEIEKRVNYYRHDHPPAGVCRNLLGLRVSGMKIIRLAARAFEAQHEAEDREKQPPDAMTAVP